MRMTLGEVAEEARETYKGDKSGYPTVGLEHITPEEIKLTAWDKGSDNTFTKMFRKGDILFGRRRAYLKKAAIAPFDGICSGDITVIRAVPEKIVPGLLPFIIQNDAFFDFAVGRSAGSLSPRVKWEHLKNYGFELPDMDKQRELAEVLWAIEDTRMAYRDLTKTTDELVKSRFIEMFGDPVTNPMGWSASKLSDLGELNRGVSKHRPRNAPELLNGPYPLVQTGDVANAETFITEYSSTYSEIGLQQSRMWNKGTLCITIAANIAKTGILTFDACFPDSVVGFIAGENTNQLYIHHWFSFFQKILEEQAPQSAQKNINLQILSNLAVMLPPLDLQNDFAAFVAQADKSKLVIEETIEKHAAIRAAIMRTYFN